MNKPNSLKNIPASFHRRIIMWGLGVVLGLLSFSPLLQDTRASDRERTNVIPQVLSESDHPDVPISPLKDIPPNEADPAMQFVGDLHKAAEQGQAKDQYFLGVAYKYGLDVPKDHIQAFAWFKRAAEQDYTEAQFNLGQCYEGGEGVEKDPVQAVFWYRKAAEKGYALAQFYLGVCYADGRGVEKDLVKSTDNFRKAAEQGLVEAEQNLGIAYANGYGVARDMAQSATWFRKAAEQGLAEAQYNLGMVYATGDGVEKDYVQASAWYRKAAEQGLAAAQFRLGLAYAFGGGVEKDSDQAIEWIRKAADQGFAEAQYELGLCYYEGDSVEQDYFNAYEWFRKAGEQGYALAQFWLGKLYEKGKGVVLDLDESFNWFLKAAEQGDPKAQMWVAMSYFEGDRVEKDPLKGFEWTRKAAEKGLAIAQGHLGALYYDGIGVIQDDRKACLHFLIANALGCPELSKWINILRNDRLSAAEYNDARREADAWMMKFNAGAEEIASQKPEFISAKHMEKLPGTGSGFVISRDGYFLTCAHVIENGRNIMVRLGTKIYPAELIRTDSRNDVALLKLDDSDFQPLPLSPSLPKMGDKVFTVGFPNPELQGVSAKYTDGVISSLTGILDDVRTMQITVPIQGGNSGGPLMDAEGNALGLVVAQLNAEAVFEYTGTIPQNVNFAIKISYALPLVQSIPGLAKNLPQPQTANPDTHAVDRARAASGLVLVYE